MGGYNKQTGFACKRFKQAFSIDSIHIICIMIISLHIKKDSTMYDIENSIGFLLSKAYQHAWAILKEEIEEYDLTPPQFALLCFLWQQDGLTQAELAEKCQVDRSTLGGLIDRLERNGLLERRRHPQDRRAYRICLTEQGKNMESTLSACAGHSLKQITSGLNEDEVKELRRMLKILRGERRVYEIPSC